MARDATARLYDVQRGSVVLKKLAEKEKYDQGTFTFRAKKGRLIDLDKLHESVWATRLSGGTRSGLVSLEVTVVGKAAIKEQDVIFAVAGTDAHFILVGGSQGPGIGQQNVFDFTLKKDSRDKQRAKFDELKRQLQRGREVVRVTGIVDGWSGLWPKVLRKLPPKPRRIVVSSFETKTTAKTANTANTANTAETAKTANTKTAKNEPTAKSQRENQ